MIFNGKHLAQHVFPKNVHFTTHNLKVYTYLRNIFHSAYIYVPTTLQKKEVCTQLYFPAKHFKICHIYVIFSFFISSNFEFYLVNAIQSMSTQTSARNEKRKKLEQFSFSINMENFEVFRWNIKLSINLFFLKSALLACKFWFKIALHDTSKLLQKYSFLQSSQVNNFQLP